MVTLARHGNEKNHKAPLQYQYTRKIACNPLFMKQTASF